MQRIAVALFAALAALAATAPPALAADSPPVAVLSVEMTGDAEPELRPRVAASIAEGLEAGDRPTIPLGEVLDALTGAPELLGCTSTACLERIAEHVGTGEFVRATLRTEGVTYRLTITHLSEAEDDPVVSELEAQCAVCTKRELFAWLAASAEELLRPERTATAQVAIRSDPAGAEIRVGGQSLGTSPTEAELPVGAHEITAELDGYAGARTEFEVEAGNPGPHELELPLVPAGEAGGASGPYGPWRWVAAGGAAAGVAAGATFLALDGRQTCELEPPQTQCAEVFDGIRPGLASFAAGAVLGGLSGWMFYRDATSGGGAGDRDHGIAGGPGTGGSVVIRF